MTFLLLFLILGLGACGYKAAPSPAFSAPDDRFTEEITRRKSAEPTPVPTVTPTASPTVTSEDKSLPQRKSSNAKSK